MNKSVQIAIFLLLSISAHINIAKSKLLEQVKDLAFTANTIQKKDLDLNANLNALTPEDYEHIAWNTCAQHGSEQAAISDIEYATLEDTKIIKVILNILEKYTLLKFTKPAIVKQLTLPHPTRKDAIQSLENNKAIIQSIIKDENFNNLKQTFKEASYHEEAVIGLYQHTTDNQIKINKEVDKSLYPFSNRTKNKFTVELYNRYWQFQSTFPLILVPIIDNLIFDKLLEKLLLNKFFKNNNQKTIAPAKLLRSFMTLITIADTGYQYFNCYRANKEHLDKIQLKQEVLIHTNRYLKALKNTAEIIKNDTQLAQLFEKEIKQINELFDPSSISISKELHSLINNVMSGSFSESTSYFLSQIGKIVTTYDALEANKLLLVPYFEILSKFETHFAFASLYKESLDKNSPVKICLPTVSDQDRPLIKAEKLWHPMINPSNVVSNNMYLGTQDIKQNWIITGPNAGGKTTAITALIINIYLSQNFGIAFADELLFTPFSAILSALNVTTNLSNNESRFKAEVNRAKTIKTYADQSNANCLVFTAVDEPFSGTDVNAAAQYAYQYLNMLGNYRYQITVATTHLPKLTELEKNTENYTNMKVGDAIINSDKIISYPFTIEPGISTQNIATNILEAENVF